ncbi:MAG: class I SAM-dependent methyltransferase [Candidatus Pacebacteria bacterium]|nr:class I SAM-dependent methyltransferase [Candidatus Paceibacterota bacterium]
MRGVKYYASWRHFSGFASLYVRKGVFELFMKHMNPTEQTKILDVGVTGDLVNHADNYFEELYPWPQNITALGVEDASYLESKYPGLKFIKADGKKIPFGDKSFDIVFSSATAEHVGSRDNQQQFINEIMRVGKKVFVTTPDRFFPIEVHTGIPLLHWLPVSIYRKILKSVGLDFFSREENLNLLSKKDFSGLFNDKAVVIKRKIVSLVAIKNT